MTAYLNALGVICALGRDKQSVARKLFAGDCSGMRPRSEEHTSELQSRP